ncbi:protein POOR HOMOLOGOUS SYNAPSIS 1 [Euphorbia lathyris]|uniref:protein POOR HOMOLOGOUS SYNAPSIS 1 n=1 Tax=Euphorbia lathyris TaxID=212925 RepID=UPI00331350C2
MAGSLALIESEPMEKPVFAFKDQWEVSFSRFVVCPSLPSTCSSLVPLPNTRRQPRIRGTWISSQSPTASLQLLNSHSISDAILSVSFGDYILEEHYVSKLHFTWPQVSCLSGFSPPRGSRAVFVSYRDSLGEFQKFAFRFASVSEAETFINELKDILKDFTETVPLNTDFQSEISSQSEFLSTNRSSSRVCEEESLIMSPVIRNSDKLPVNLSNEVEGDSCTNKIAPSQRSEGESTALPSDFASFSTDCNEMISNNEVEVVSCNEEPAHYNHEGTSTGFPPSFASFLANCYPEVKQATDQPSSSDDNDLKSEIARLMEDSSFKEMLIKVEKVINEIGGDLL